MSYNDTITLAQLADALDHMGIEPADTYTADSGQDYGYVRAWDMGRIGYLVAYGDNGSTDYDLLEDIGDLAACLESHDVYGWDRVIQAANVRGLDAVDAADEADEAEAYRVLVSRHYYGPTTGHEWATGDDGEPLEFGAYSEAQDWIDSQEDGTTYCCAHNEAEAPTYTIIAN